MAGVVPTRRAASGRKQWTIPDGHRGSLKRLRNQLANDGCPESQVVLAKQLLEERCDIENDTERMENAKLGVYWLMKASEQGNLEATDLLRKCFDNGKGITEHNFLDVKSCISMTQDEKLARKAAREMFASLSNGEDYITSNQLQKKMLAISKKPYNNDELKDTMNHVEIDNGEFINNYSDSEESEDIDWTLRAKGNDEKLTEDHLISAAVDYSHGQLPLVNRVLCLTDPNLNGLDHIPFLYRSVLHPLLAFKILYYKIIKFLGKQPFLKNIPFTTSDLQLITLLFAYCFISSDNTIFFVPIFLYYGSFILLMVTTFQMLQTKREFLDFKIWSGLFITYSGGSLNAKQAEFQYIRNNLKPYGYFFIALMTNLMIHPVILEQWILQSEITVVAFCLTFMTLFGFMKKRNSKTVFDFLVLFSFAINVLARYPYETDTVVMQGWRFLDLKMPTFASYVIGNGIEFCINFRILLYASIPVLFIRIASKENWRGIYKDLIPHCVTLSWLQIVITNSQYATMFGLLRGTLALVGFALFLPLAGLTTIIIPAAALTKWMISFDVFYSLSIFLILTIFGLSISWLVARSNYNRYVAALQILLTIIALIFLIRSSIYEQSIGNRFYEVKDLPKTISWNQYEQFCYEPPNQQNTLASVQLTCMKLDNTPIQWEGYVKDVSIESVKNKWKTGFDYFPKFLRDYLYCFYGEEIVYQCHDTNEISKDFCMNFYDVIKSNYQCSLDKYNIYEFLITVRMQYRIWEKGVEISLKVSDIFKNFTMQLHPEDHIWFKGKLINDKKLRSSGMLGSSSVYVEINEIGCISCANNKLTEIKNEENNDFNLKRLINDIYLGIKCVLNFLFNPLFEIK